MVHKTTTKSFVLVLVSFLLSFTPHLSAQKITSLNVWDHLTAACKNNDQDAFDDCFEHLYSLPDNCFLKISPLIKKIPRPFFPDPPIFLFPDPLSDELSGIKKNERFDELIILLDTSAEARAIRIRDALMPTRAVFIHLPKGIKDPGEADKQQLLELFG